MANIVMSVYMARDPLAGLLVWNLHWATGLRALGHEVWLVEKANYPEAFFNPIENVVSDDATHGYATAAAALSLAGIRDRLCVVEYGGRHHGLSRQGVETILQSADVLLDLGNHGAWLPEAQRCPIRVLVDGEPGYTQIKMQTALERGERTAEYDYHYTNGANVGRPPCIAPAAGRVWRHVFNPVEPRAAPEASPAAGAAFTTVMNWQAHGPIEFRGTVYGQKDIEFERFMNLPSRVSVPLELAVAGPRTPWKRLQTYGWRVTDPRTVTRDIPRYETYVAGSLGEFSVCKNVFVATRSGWFSDRSAFYLSRGRPVVIQDTGISNHLPTGEGLFAVDSVEEAADAIERIRLDYPRHSRAAHRIAREYLCTDVVLRRFLREIGL